MMAARRTSRISYDTWEDQWARRNYIFNKPRISMAVEETKTTSERTPRTRIWDYIMDYCSHSTIHGLVYIGELRRPKAERVVWLAAFLVSLVTCGFLIHQVWTKWVDTPMIVTLEERLRPMWQVPFPAVTICPTIKVRGSIYNYTVFWEKKRQVNLTEREQVIADVWTMMCLQQWVDVKRIDNRTIEVLEEIALDNETVNAYMTESGEEVIFNRLLTEEGLCFSANILPASKFFPEDTFHGSGRYLNFPDESWTWSTDSGYDLSAGVNTHPFRSSASLHIVVAAKVKDIEGCFTFDSSSMFKVYIHNPADFPRSKDQYFQIGIDEEVSVSFTPKVMSTSHGLRNFSPEKRQCYFSDERKLRFFKVYTRKNCEQECFANYTLSKCGCVAFYMHRELKTPICGPEEMKCVRKMPGDYVNFEVSRGMMSDNPTPNCNCLQSCSDIQYLTEVSRSYGDRGVYDSEDEDDEKTSFIDIYTFDTQFLAHRRGELYGQIDFIANCGGVLGLGMGISILSLFEMIYWMCVRVWKRTRQPVS